MEANVIGLKILNTFVRNLPVKGLNTVKLHTVLNLQLLKLETIFITFFLLQYHNYVKIEVTYK